MKLLKRLTEFSVGELHRLQKAIMREVLRRKELSGAAPTSDGSTVVGQEPDEDGQSVVPMPNPAPNAAKRAPRRRAA
jgi:hypothetical protein